MKAFATLLAASALCCCAVGAAVADELALFVRGDSPVQALSSLELRKLYLGVPVARAGMRLRPLRELSDPHATQIFLQNALAMSEAAYERWWLTATLRDGTGRPAEFANGEALRASVAADPAAVGVGWVSGLAADRRLRVVRVLWRD
ncbi:MAG: hypothetical protein WCH32_16880 [Pseudomonadota bacterium]